MEWIKCFPVLCYGLVACPLRESQYILIDYVINSWFRKVFDTKLQKVIGVCLGMFNCLPVQQVIALCKSKFFRKFSTTDNVLRRACADNAVKEMSSWSSVVVKYLRVFSFFSIPCVYLVCMLPLWWSPDKENRWYVVITMGWVSVSVPLHHKKGLEGTKKNFPQWMACFGAERINKGSSGKWPLNGEDKECNTCLHYLLTYLLTYLIAAKSGLCRDFWTYYTFDLT